MNATQHVPTGATPGHLRQIIVDFEAQIEAMNARLRELAPGDASNRINPVVEELR